MKVEGRAASPQDEGDAETEPAVYRPDLAGTLNNLGNVLADQRRLDEAEAAYREAEGLYRALEDDLTLLARFRDGDQKAFERLLARYERQIARMAFDLAPPDSPAAPLRKELYDAGCVGFWEACKRYDPKHAAKARLWPYARRWVRGAMIKELANWMELADDTRKVYRRVKACRDELLQQLGREPTEDEIAGCAGTTVGRVREIFSAWARPTFSDLTASGVGEGDEENDFPAPDERPDIVHGKPGPFPSPGERAKIIALNEFVEQTFATSPGKASKFMVLCILDLEQIPKSAWAQYLTNPGPHDLARSWPDHWERYGRGGTLPATWPSVCALFATPPPPSEPSPPLNRNALAQFMYRCQAALQAARGRYY